MNIKNSILMISRTLKNVKQAQQLPVTTDSLGMAKPESLQREKSIFEDRIHMPDKTDVLTLDPGYYSLYDAINSPLDGNTIWLIDVTKAGSDRIYKATSPATGETYMKIIRSGESEDWHPTPWVQEIRRTTLWAGSLSDSNTVITLNDDLNYYRGLEIGYVFCGNFETKKITMIYKDGNTGNFLHAIPSSINVNTTNINNDVPTKPWRNDLEFHLQNPEHPVFPAKNNKLKINFLVQVSTDLESGVGQLDNRNMNFQINYIDGLK